ncbi:MAG: ATP-binding protein [Clostridium sp.]
MSEEILPRINEAAIMKEIALNIINPLELIREGLSNSADAEAKDIIIRIYRDSEGVFCISIKDNGNGMDKDSIHSFFNLGDSTSNKNSIGEKGLGTKIYYRSRKIVVKTKKSNKPAYIVIMNNPWNKIINKEIPVYEVDEYKKWSNGDSGTEIIIKGYIVDNPERYFVLETLKDYIKWFTVGGSFKYLFANDIKLQCIVKGIDSILRITIIDDINNKKETISGVHNFHQPQEFTECINGEVGRASDNYCRHFGPYNRETNIGGEYVSVQIYGTVSGVNCRKAITNLRKGETYKSRFGLYLCKDFIPIIRRNDLLQDEQYYHYHILVNSQNFELTADRDNISNGNTNITNWVFKQVKEILNKQIKPIAKREYFEIRKQEDEIDKINKKALSIQKRLTKLREINNLDVKGIPIIKIPQYEYEVALLFTALLTNRETKKYLLDINEIITYSNSMATDMICYTNNYRKVLVEVEYRLSNIFKHKHPTGTYDYIVCWRVDIEENIMKDLYGNKVVLYKNEKNELILNAGNRNVKIINLSKIVNSIRVV